MVSSVAELAKSFDGLPKVFATSATVGMNSSAARLIRLFLAQPFVPSARAVTAVPTVGLPATRLHPSGARDQSGPSGWTTLFRSTVDTACWGRSGLPKIERFVEETPSAALSVFVPSAICRGDLLPSPNGATLYQPRVEQTRALRAFAQPWVNDPT